MQRPALLEFVLVLQLGGFAATSETYKPKLVIQTSDTQGSKGLFCEGLLAWRMVVAFVLMNADPESLEDVLKALKAVDGVREAYCVYGIYDIAAKVEVEDMERLRDIVTWKTGKLWNVRSTRTMLVME